MQCYCIRLAFEGGVRDILEIGISLYSLSVFYTVLSVYGMHLVHPIYIAHWASEYIHTIFITWYQSRVRFRAYCSRRRLRPLLASAATAPRRRDLRSPGRPLVATRALPCGLPPPGSIFHPGCCRLGRRSLLRWPPTRVARAAAPRVGAIPHGRLQGPPHLRAVPPAPRPPPRRRGLRRARAR